MNALEQVLRRIIDAQGPISLAAYVELALQHPIYGYYRTHEPIGRTGDFITAPEVSKMFGEIVGVWCAETWKQYSSPKPFALIELGPGRGFMMNDLLRATAHVGRFHESKKLYLIDTNELLKKQQQKILGDQAPEYIDDIGQIPPMPLFVIANEFFDSLPVRQFEKTFTSWAERMVGVENDRLGLILRPLSEAETCLIPPHLNDAKPGTVYEFSTKAQYMMKDLARALSQNGGAMLLIDYGYVAASGTPTLQAVSGHAFADIFKEPGDVDLTAHVDFTALGDIARDSGLTVSPVVGQGEFLRNWGIEIRADTLKKKATEPQAAGIDSAMRRLTDDDQMGTLFKVMEIKG